MHVLRRRRRLGNVPNRAARGIKQKIDYISMETDYLDGDMSNIVNIMLYTLPR